MPLLESSVAKSCLCLHIWIYYPGSILQDTDNIIGDTASPQELLEV